MLFDAHRRRPNQARRMRSRTSADGARRPFSYVDRFGRGTPAARASYDWLRPAATRSARISTTQGWPALIAVDMGASPGQEFPRDLRLLMAALTT